MIEDGDESWLNGKSIQNGDLVALFFATAMSALYLGTTIPCLQYISKGKAAAARISKIIEKSKQYDGNHEATNLEGHI